MKRNHKTYSQLEKAELLERIKSAGPNVRQTLREVGISKSTYYGWRNAIATRNSALSCAVTTKRRLYMFSLALKHERAIGEALAASTCSPKSPLAKKLAAMAVLHESGKFSVHALCDAYRVNRGTFYNYMRRGKVKTGEIWYLRRREEMKRDVERIYHGSEQRFGAQKIVDVLRKEGIVTTRQYVLEIMRGLGLKSIRQNAKTTFRRLNAHRVNIVARRFNATTPNAVWVGDVTYFRVKGRTFYVCAVIDLYSRMVVAYSVGRTNSTRLTKATLAAALKSRQPPEGLVFHSDQGANYTSRAYGKFLFEHGVKQSFSASGRPHDNAVAESFFRNLKTEELYRRNYRSFNEFKAGVAEYIRFYNEKRPHAANNGLTPLEKDRS